MLSDFLILERYYDTPEAARFYEDISQRYGLGAVQKAVHAGYLVRKRIELGPDSGRMMLWLSDKGREKARMEIA